MNELFLLSVPYGVSALKPRTIASTGECDAVAVSDPLPAYRAGLVAAFNHAGVVADTPADLLQWAEERSQPGIAITLDSHEDEIVLGRLARLASKPYVVVMVSAPVAERIRDIWSLGALSVVERTSSPDTIVRALMLASDGHAVLPAAAVEVIARRLPEAALPELSQDQRMWLEALARAETIAKIARRSGYSTREMHRVLAKFYDDLGVRGRIGAIALAGRYGIR